MTAPLDLPGEIHVAPPVLSPIVMSPPPEADVHVLPVQGPVGPRGPVGPAGAELGLAGGWVHVQSNVVPAGQPVQISHLLTYKPAGIVCKEDDGGQLEYSSVVWPADGLVEVTFGVPFRGTITLS